MTKSYNALETTRRQIQRGGKIMYVLCRLVQLGLLLFIVSQVVLLVITPFHEPVGRFVLTEFEHNHIFRVLTLFPEFNALPLTARAMIGAFTSLLVAVILLLYGSLFARMMKYLSDGQRPFTVENARKIRRRFWLALLMCFYNLPFGLIFTGLIFLMSYLMEYGGYIQQTADATNRIQEEMIYSFAEITENKSGQTGKHIKRVSEYSRILAEQLGLPHDQCEQIRITSTMHDIGKLMIPAEILEKPGKLTNEEFEVIKTHTTYGGKLLEHVEGDEMKLSRTIALEHHERYDGNGYPNHLKGDAISLEGRIVAVADVYDALTSRRSYKEKWEESRAYEEIVKGKGTQFDPQVVDAFIAAHDQIVAVQKQFADSDNNEKEQPNQ